MPPFQTLRARLSGVPSVALVATLCALLAAPAGAVPTQEADPAAQAAAPESVTLSADQLDSLVAPIALYPDPLLAQCLVAATYPVDIIAAQQWLARNTSLKGDELVKAAEKQPWDPSVQALVTLPDALKILSENIQWTQDLGDAFLASQESVMDAVQRLRTKAKDAGKLDSSEQQKVETKTVESKTVIEIQPASTQVVYVPTYSPSVIWGAPVYPYPPMYYPPYYAGGALIGFGVGMAIGIGMSGGWGWGCGWGGGGNTININNNNNFVNNSNRQNNISNKSGNSNWQHNSQQRGGAPYKDKATASKYGGGARGDSASSRQSQAGQRQAQSTDRGGASNRSSSGSSNRGGSSASSFDRGGSKSSQVGSRNVPSSSSRSSSSAFSGSSRSGSSARSSSSRGASSMSRGGGGGGRRR